jgi:hypothetical protein
VADALAAAGLSPTAVTGTRLALEPGRGRTAVPIRSAIAGAAAAVCAVVAVGVFGASLARLVGTPAAYGWTWDVSVGNFASPAEAQGATRVLDSTPGVDGYAGVATEELLIDGKRVQFMAIEPSKGTVPLQVLEGREPVRPGEVALGTATLRELGKQIGGTVTMTLAPGQPSQRLRVVGRLVLSAGPMDTAIAPGKGAVIDFEMARRLAPESLEVARRCSWSASIPPPTEAEPSRRCDAPSRARWFVPSRTPTSRTSGGSSTCPRCLPP